MSEEYIIREYRETDLEDVVNLVDMVFNGWPQFHVNCSNMDHYRWKYLDKFKDMNSNVVALKDGELVGAYHEFHHKLKFFDEVVDSSLGSDVAVHPDHRGKGLWTNMMKHFNVEFNDKRPFHIVHYMTGNPIVIQRLKKIRDALPHSLCNLVWINDIDKHLEKIPMDNNLVIKAGYSTLRALNSLQNMLSKPKKATDLIVETVTEFPPEYDEFWAEASKKYDLIVEKDRGYLNWRYSDPRSGEFVFKLARDSDGRIQGFIVYSVNDKIENYPVGFIVDLLTRDNSPETFNLLFENALSDLVSKKVNIINYLMVQNHPYSRYANSYGFLDSRIRINVFVTISNNKERFQHIANSPPEKIYFSWGDHDSQPLGVKRISE